MYMRMQKKSHRRGLTLIECIIVVTVLGVVAVGAGVGLQAVAKTPSQADQQLAVSNALMHGVEVTLAQPWASMTSGTSTVQIYGVNYTRTITVADANPQSNDGTGTTRTDFRRITVSLRPATQTVAGAGDASLTTWVTQK